MQGPFDGCWPGSAAVVSFVPVQQAQEGRPQSPVQRVAAVS